MIQLGNWRGARDVVWELISATHRKPIIQHEKNCGTSLVPAKSTGTGPEPVPAQNPPEPGPEFRSGHQPLPKSF